MNSEHVLAQIVLRAWPFANGSGRLVDKLFSRLRFSTSTTQVTTSDGFKIKINPNDLIGRHIYLTGKFDRAIVEILCDFSEPDDILLDVGANIGYVSGCFLNNVPRSHSIAVEPQEAILELLRSNLPRERSTIIPAALSDRDGEVWFQLDPANPGGAHIVANGDRPGTVRVSTVSAATVLGGLAKLDLVKIDAEGHERTIVDACLPEFDRLQPRTIVFEDKARDVRHVEAQLAAIGYRTFAIHKTLMATALDTRRQSGDYVAVSTRRSIPELALRKYHVSL